MREHLTTRELQFLQRLGVSSDDVFDGRGLTQAGWKRRAKEAGKDIVLGNPCRNGRHRLKTRGGHCVQCDISRFAFATRYSSDGCVYIAGSLAERLIKIGTCGDYRQRINQIRTERYGGCSDWQLLYFIETDKAGEVEDLTKKKLAAHAVSRDYTKDWVVKEAEELFRCSYTEAWSALFAVSENFSLTNFGGVGVDTARYEFKK